MRFPFGGLAALDDRDGLIRLRSPEMEVQELVAAAFRRFENRCVPLLRTVDSPVLELAGDFAQYVPAHRILLAIRVEETDHTLRLLKRLNETVQQSRSKHR